MRNNEIKDPVKFKHELYKKLWKQSGAKTIDEYVKYVRENAIKSPLWNTQKPKTKTQKKYLTKKHP